MVYLLPPRFPLLTAAVVLLAACGPTVENGSDDSSSSTSQPTTETTDAGSSGSGSSSSGASTTSIAEGTSTGEDSSTTAVVFPEDCDVFAQDCPGGYKCAPIANDGGQAWNDSSCVPVVDEPAGLGETCSVQQTTSPDGIDDCGVGAMCWNVDARTLEGTCVGLCMGPADARTCEDPNAVCVESAEGYFNPCWATCDPLADDCGTGEVCTPAPGGPFVCVPSVDSGALGDSCDFPNACGPGLGCVPPAPGVCNEPLGTGCCLPWCSLTTPDCPDSTDCTPWWESDPPEGYEDVGVCQAP